MEIKHLNKKNLGFFSMLSTEILYFIMAMFFITKKSVLIFAVKGLLNLLTILLITTAFLQLLGLLVLKSKKLSLVSRLVAFVSNIVLSLLIYYRPEYIVSILPLSFGIYAFSIGKINCTTIFLNLVHNP